MSSVPATGAAGLGRDATRPGRLTPAFMALLVVTSAACGSSRPTDEPAHTPATAPTAGQVRADPKGVEQVWVPAGSFMMGTDDATLARSAYRHFEDAPDYQDVHIGFRIVTP